jgi:hypothetical protein
MAKLRIFNDNNSIYIGGKAFQPGSLTASESSGNITVSQNHNSKQVFTLRFDQIADKDGNAWGATAATTLTALNNYIGATNPDGIIKSTDKITALTGVTASDFTSKPGYGVFVGSADGSLQTSDALVLDTLEVRLGTSLDTNGNNITSNTNQHIKFFPGSGGNVGIGTNSPSEKLTVRSGTIKIDDGSNPYVFPTADGANGQVLQTDGFGNLSFATVSGSGGGLGSSDQTLTADRIITLDGNSLTIEDSSTQNHDALIINSDGGVIVGPGGGQGAGFVQIREASANGSNYVQLSAPASLTSSTNFTLPSADGTNGQVLTTNGSGALSFTTASGSGGGLGSADQTLAADRTIDTNGFNLDIELDPTGTPDTFTIHDGTHDLFQVDTGTTGTIFSVNDVSGLPQLSVNSNGMLKQAGGYPLNVTMITSTANYASADQRFFPMGTSEAPQTSLTSNSNYPAHFCAPFNGKLLRIVCQFSLTDPGSTVVGFHKATHAASLSTTASATVTVAPSGFTSSFTNPTVFDFENKSTDFNAGDVLAFSFDATNTTYYVSATFVFAVDPSNNY